MGWRAIRMALDRPALLQLQLRALLMAAAGRELRVMFPMIAEVAEFRAAKALVEEEKRYLTARGHQLPPTIKLGAMIEVPALIWQLDRALAGARFRLDRLERSDCSSCSRPIAAIRGSRIAMIR